MSGCDAQYQMTTLCLRFVFFLNKIKNHIELLISKQLKILLKNAKSVSIETTTNHNVLDFFQNLTRILHEKVTCMDNIINSYWSFMLQQHPKPGVYLTSAVSTSVWWWWWWWVGAFGRGWRVGGWGMEGGGGGSHAIPLASRSQLLEMETSNVLTSHFESAHNGAVPLCQFGFSPDNW